MWPKHTCMLSNRRLCYWHSKSDAIIWFSILEGIFWLSILFSIALILHFRHLRLDLMSGVIFGRRNVLHVALHSWKLLAKNCDNPGTIVCSFTTLFINAHRDKYNVSLICLTSLSKYMFKYRTNLFQTREQLEIICMASLPEN